MAKWMPSRSRPGDLAKKSNGCSEPPASSSASCVGLELLGRDVLADVHVAVEDDALRLHLLHAPLDDVLLHLEVGDAVAQQPAGLGALLVDVHLVAGARELLGGSEPRRARADDGDASCRSCVSGGSGAIQPSAKAWSAMAHSMVLMVTGSSSMLSVQDGLARRRAHAARHLGEVVGRVQVERRRLPLVAVDEVVPVGDLVVHRAAGVAIGDAAVHAARGLRLAPPPAAAARRTRANASRARRRAR